MNISNVKKILAQCFQAGVREICVCAGARNSPFLFQIEKTSGFKIYSFFEERDAGFFAVGRMIQTERPVVVLTTSGTAVAELLPATIEAHYNQYPLVILSADRPSSYRGSGAPQTIEQVGIFSHYVSKVLDIQNEVQPVMLKDWDLKTPIHINLCIDEPLIDEKIEDLSLEESHDFETGTIKIDIDKSLFDFTKKYQSPMVILSTIPKMYHEDVIRALLQLRAPIYCETTSGLRAHPAISELVVRGGERMINRAFANGMVDSLIVFGRVPTVRIWRDLEQKYKDTPVMVVSDTKFTGLSRKCHNMNIWYLRGNKLQESKFSEVFFKEDFQAKEKLDSIFKKYPLSEQALIRKLSQHTKDQNLYLGNSLPIREWDLCEPYKYQNFSVAANRGANGIDGQVATFLGWASNERENWCVIGDLTALYNLSALWITDQLEDCKWRIVVINNNGGKIFDRMFGRDIFINNHNIEFKNWAQMWSWNYQKLNDISEKLELAQRQIIELCPDADQTTKFWDEYDLIWKSKK